MVFLKYGKEVSSEDWLLYNKKLKNDIFKLLPLKEEMLDWEKHLNTVLLEITGLSSLLENNNVKIISIMAKLEGLQFTVEFFEYRKTVFEILSLLDKLED